MAVREVSEQLRSATHGFEQKIGFQNVMTLERAMETAIEGIDFLRTYVTWQER
jgi:hypothetical protein